MKNTDDILNINMTNQKKAKNFSEPKNFKKEQAKIWKKNYKINNNLYCHRYLGVCGIFSIAYACMIYKSYKSDNQIVKLAGAGSLSYLITESMFFPLDSLNLTQKLQVENISNYRMVKTLHGKYGFYGIYRGFSTSFYSSTVAGGLFFALYKGLKVKLKEIFKPQTQYGCTLIYTASSIIAEMLSMLISYPYEVIKVRFIAKNDVYNYRGVAHGMQTILKKDGPVGLYKGYNMFAINYIGSYTFTFVIYETYMDMKKRKLGNQVFKENESRFVIEASLLAGVFSGTLMNSYECLMYMRMAEVQKSAKQIFKEQGHKLFTKGLGTRIIMTSGYTLTQFTILYYLGKVFDCDLIDEMD